jgi:hypothetical protein
MIVDLRFGREGDGSLDGVVLRCGLSEEVDDFENQIYGDERIG